MLRTSRCCCISNCRLSYQTHKHIQRETDIHKDMKTQTERQIQRHTEAHKQTERQTYKDMETQARRQWLGGSAVTALDTRPKGPRFNAKPMRYQVTTLGKLFTPTCLCSVQWLVSTRIFQVAVRFSLPSFASNLEQVANPLYAQANSASYPPLDVK